VRIPLIFHNWVTFYASVHDCFTVDIDCLRLLFQRMMCACLTAKLSRVSLHFDDFQLLAKISNMLSVTSTLCRH